MGAGRPRELSLAEKPVPQPGPAEVLVRIDAIVVCATDLEIIKMLTRPPGAPSPEPERFFTAAAATAAAGGIATASRFGELLLGTASGRVGRENMMNSRLRILLQTGAAPPIVVRCIKRRSGMS